MKKLLTVVLAIIVMLSLCACFEKPLPQEDEIRGTISELEYVNEYIGLKFTKPAEWNYVTGDELDELTGLTNNTLSESGISDTISSDQIDMFAMDPETLNSVFLGTTIVGYDITDEDLDEAIKTIKEQIAEMGSSVDLEYTFSDETTVTIGDVEFRKITAKVSYDWLSFTQGSYIGIKDGVAVNITISIYDDSDIRGIEAMFSNIG